MYQVKPQDFTKIESLQTLGFYFSAVLPDGKEVCLEVCLNGFDVAIYDKVNGDLIGEKTCTNLSSFIGDVAFIIGLKIANEKLESMYGENKIWLITDTHFGHVAIKKWCNRPDNCDALMIDNLSKMINPGDVLIHLGDFCIGQDEVWHERFMQIEGKKWLVKGNHDHKSNNWYLEHGWDFVGEVIKDRYFGHNVCFSHIPQYWDGWYDINVHGHFHTTDHRRLDPEMQIRKNSYQKLLAVEAVGYQPITLESFIV